jgi:hypothetical protein
MKRIGLIFALALLPASVLADTLSIQEKQQVAGIEQVTRQIRGLAQLRPVQVVVDSDGAFNALIRAQQRAANSDSEIEVSRRESVLLGLLSRRDNLRHIVLSDSIAGIYGLYDPSKQTLYLRNHDNYVFSFESHALAHEYNHALQDQHFGLRKLLPDQTPLAYRNTDMVGAHHALTEGDSVNVEHLFVYKTYTAQELADMEKFESQPLPGGPLPKAIQRQIDFPYTYGYDFVLALYHRGGMKAVDGAYGRLPSSTYEIMHPSAYLKGWKPVEVTLHAVLGFTEWKQVDDDIWGAFGYDLILRQFLSGKQADDITGAYRGDRYVFLENADQSAMRFDSVWTDNLAARAARDAFVAELRARYKKKIHVTRGTPTVVTERDGAVAFTVIHARLTMAYAPTSVLATQLAVSQTS